MSDRSTAQEPKHFAAMGRSPLLLLLLLALVRGCLYAVVVPPWQAPDEQGHFEHAWLTAHVGRVPTAADISPLFERELLGSLYEWRYGDFTGRPLPAQMPDRIIFARWPRTVPGRFSVAYIWTAVLIRPFRYQDLVVQLYAARLASVVLELGITWLAWQIFRQLLPHQPKLAVAMTAFVVFLPQHTFINASVGEGPLAELCAYLVLYGWLRLLLWVGRVQDVIAVVMGTLIGMWAKRTVAFLLPLDLVMAVAFLWSIIRQRMGWPWKLSLSLVVLTALVLVGWGAWETPVGNWMRVRIQQMWPSPEFRWENGGLTVYDALRFTFESFWGRFGWMNVSAGYGWYVLIYILTALAIEGWLWPRSRSWSVPPQGVGLLIIALVLCVLGWLSFMVTYSDGLAYCQGRYLFPVTVPVAFFIVGGWARCVPPHWQHRFPQIVVILLASLDAAAFCLTLWPFFYGQ